MAKATCSIPDCSQPVRCRGWCALHYDRWRHRGTPTPPPPPTREERFWAKVDRRGPDECWVWIAGFGDTGYGSFNNNGRTVNAHRFAYEMLVGPVPPGFELDHLCRVRACVNPAHMEPVTHRENDIRGMAPGMSAYRANRCMHGHALDDPSNVYMRHTDPPKRVCKRCGILRARPEWRDRDRAAPHDPDKCVLCLAADRVMDEVRREIRRGV